MGAILSRRRNAETDDLLKRVTGIDARIVKSRERHASLEATFKRVTFYFWAAVAALVAVSVAYATTRPRTDQRRVLPVVGVVVAGFSLWWLVAKAFRVLISRRAAAVAALEKEKSGHIDELIEKTNFLKVQEVIQAHKNRMQQSPATPATPSAAAATPQKANNNKTPATTPSRPAAAPAPSGPTPIPAAPQAIRPRTALDKIVDYMTESGPANRFALICRTCHAHNGLVRTAEEVERPFKCYACGELHQGKPRPVKETEPANKEEKEQEPEKPDETTKPKPIIKDEK
jgi:hypothetical protein